jgi:glycosyltransferase involved in cell wall biosynthesis
MIVKNEESVISRCLTSVKDIVDEIIIVDTGSTDNTKKIAKNFTEKIYDFKWINDFSAARNYSYSKATKDFILWLDADDVILEEDRMKFIELKKNLDLTTDMVMMKYNVGFDNDGKVNFSYYRERLSNRSKNFLWHEPVHECLDRSWNSLTSDVCITHKKERPAEPGRNLKIYENIISSGDVLSPRATYYYARELYYNGIYDKSIIFFNKFLNNGQGWIEDNIRACCDLSSCYFYKKDKNNMLKSLFRSFEYDIPRGDVCCLIGSYYFNESDYVKAIYWYKSALESKKPDENSGFVTHDYWGYTPCIQLCICYFRIGNTEDSIKYNNLAANYKPNDSSVVYNKTFFENISDKNKEVKL